MLRLVQRCGNDVGKAVEELKVEKLVDMGLAPSRTAAQDALQRYSWPYLLPLLTARN